MSESIARVAKLDPTEGSGQQLLVGHDAGGPKRWKHVSSVAAWKIHATLGKLVQAAVHTASLAPAAGPERKS